MNKCCLIEKSSGQTQTGGLELLDQWQQESHFLWLDLADGDKAAHRDLLESNFGIDTLAVDDALRTRHPPKYEPLNNDLQFILLRGLDDASTDIRFSHIQIGFFFNQQYLITRHSENSLSTKKIWTELTSGGIADRFEPEWLAYRVMRAICDRYLPIVTALEERLEDIEGELINSPSDKLLAELLEYSRELKRLRRIGLYHENAFKRLRDPNYGNPLCLADAGFHDLYEQAERLANLAQLYQEITADLINGYVSVSSHRLNNVMRVLTVITAIFVPLTFIAGIYGMNFEYIPELKFRNGYFVAMGTMGAIAIALIALFRHKKWL